MNIVGQGNLPFMSTDGEPNVAGDAKPKSPSDRRRMFRDACLILFCGAAFRFLYQIAFRPCWSGDSLGYSSMFYYWTQHTYSTSERPPVFALFLGLAQWLAGDRPLASGMGTASQYLVVWLQGILGLAAALVVYASLRALEVRPRIALAGGLAFSVIGAVCLFERLILTELLALFFITFGSFFFICSTRALQARADFRWPAMSGGLCFTLAILTRPENVVFFVTLIGFLFLLCIRTRFRTSLHWASWRLVRLALLLAVSTAPLVILWMSWNLLSIGQFRLNTLTGVTRTESVYNLFDRVDSADRVAGDLLQKSYLLKNRNGTIYRHHVWEAMPELTRAWQLGLLPVRYEERLPSNRHVLELRHWLERHFGLRERIVVNGVLLVQPIDLYDYLGVLSGRLAWRYPTIYVGNVVDNFLTDTFDYSYAPPEPAETNNPHAPEGGSVVRHVRLYNVAVWINRIEAPLLKLGYVVLLGYVLFSPLVIFGATDESLLRNSAVVGLAVAAFSVVAVSCAVAAYYPEHGIPFLGVLLVCACFAVDNRKGLVRALSGR